MVICSASASVPSHGSAFGINHSAFGIQHHFLAWSRLGIRVRHTKGVEEPLDLVLSITAENAWPT